MAIWRAFWKQVDSLSDPMIGAVCLLLLLFALNGIGTPQSGVKLLAVSAPARTVWMQLHVRSAELCPVRLLEHIRLGR